MNPYNTGHHDHKHHHHHNHGHHGHHHHDDHEKVIIIVKDGNKSGQGFNNTPANQGFNVMPVMANQGFNNMGMGMGMSNQGFNNMVNQGFNNNPYQVSLFNPNQ